MIEGVYQSELQVKSLCCIRENRTLFSNLTFSVGSKEWLQIQGRNGSGKSSLLKMLVGLLPKGINPSCRGHSQDVESLQDILWRGKPINFTDPAYLKDLFYMGHKSGIHLGLTVMENLEFYSKLQEAQEKEEQNKAGKNKGITKTITSALKKFDLEKVANVVCEELSAGFCQRVALARLCFSTAKLWVLDEPCTALDQPGIAIFCQILTQHLQIGGIAIIVSHTPLHTLDAGLKHRVLFLEKDEDYFSRRNSTLLKAIIKRDLLFYFRHREEILIPLLFFVMICSLFSIAFPDEPKQLAWISPMVLWIVGLLSTLFSIETCYRSDFQNGSLEQILTSACSLTTLVLGKFIAHWLSMSLPLTILSPVLALSMNLPFDGIVALVVTFLLGLPLINLLASLGVVLTLGLHRGGIFLSILMLPLLMPVVLLSMGAVNLASVGLNWSGQIALLLAMLILCLCFIPWVIGKVLRISTQT